MLWLTMFLDKKQDSDMEYPSMTVNVSLLVVDGYFLDTHNTCYPLQDFSCVSLGDSWI